MRKEMEIMDDIVFNLKEAFNIEATDRIENMDQIIKYMGGDFNRVEFINNNEVAELIKREEKFEINIINNLSPKFEKFYTGIKLGELFIGMRYKINDKYWNSFENNKIYEDRSEEMERRSIQFSMSFLVPREKFMEIMKQNYNGNGSYDIDKVADYFGVDKKLILFRARELYIIH